LATPAGEITADGLHTNLSVALQYLAGWLGGLGCVPINNLMEDAATAEISRAQVWQWLRHGTRLSDGRYVTRELVLQTISEELFKLKQHFGTERFDSGKFGLASQLFEQMMTGGEFPEFMTLVAYSY